MRNIPSELERRVIAMGYSLEDVANLPETGWSI